MGNVMIGNKGIFQAQRLLHEFVSKYFEAHVLKHAEQLCTNIIRCIFHNQMMHLIIFGPRACDLDNSCEKIHKTGRGMQTGVN